MSYPSISEIMTARGLSLETASDRELRDALWEAFNVNLKEGVQYLTSLAAEVKESGKKVVRPEDPDSPLGKKIIRLLGTDVARSIMSERLGVPFALYNCCCAVAAPSAEELEVSAREQIAMQDGTIASANC
jgi:hypothetical protein